MSSSWKRPRTPQAWRTSLSARLRDAASKNQASAPELRKQFVFALLFRRMFRDHDDRWLVLGGNALILRTGGGRFTQDVDLSRAQGWESEDELKEELDGLLGRDVGDPFTFIVQRVDPHDHLDPYGYGTRTAKAHIAVLLGGVEFDNFTIDLSQRRHVTGPVDYLQPSPVIEHELLEDLPLIPVIPVENHTADKICAMYEVHPQPTTWSTRYRDLADLVRIVRDLKIDARRLTDMLSHEQQRREISELPVELCSPHESWAVQYPAAARDFAGFPAGLCSLDASLDDPEFGYRFLVGEAAVAGEVMCERTAWRICRDNRWWSVFGKKRGKNGKRPGPPVHDDLVKRDFTADDVNELWLTDITEHWTDEGKLYLCAIKDVFSGRIVGYSISDRMKARLAVNALDNAISRRRDAGGCIVHSDRGSQFRSRKFVHALNHHHLIGSMGQVGAAGDNAAMESFFSLLQKNVLNRKRWRTREELRIAIITWIERTYHRRRRQARLGRLTPIEYETIMNPAVDLAA